MYMPFLTNCSAGIVFYGVIDCYNLKNMNDVWAHDADIESYFKTYQRFVGIRDKERMSPTYPDEMLYDIKNELYRMFYGKAPTQVT